MNAVGWIFVVVGALCAFSMVFLVPGVVLLIVGAILIGAGGRARTRRELAGIRRDLALDRSADKVRRPIAGRVRPGQTRTGGGRPPVLEPVDRQ